MENWRFSRKAKYARLRTSTSFALLRFGSRAGVLWGFHGSSVCCGALSRARGTRAIAVRLREVLASAFGGGSWTSRPTIGFQPGVLRSPCGVGGQCQRSTVRFRTPIYYQIPPQTASANFGQTSFGWAFYGDTPHIPSSKSAQNR